MEGDGFTVAPVSHVPNAVHLYAAGAAAAELGLAVLQPGESLMAQLRLTVEGTA
jgi:galactose mutarotase-like enzyme